MKSTLIEYQVDSISLATLRNMSIQLSVLALATFSASLSILNRLGGRPCLCVESWIGLARRHRVLLTSDCCHDSVSGFFHELCTT